MSLSSSFPTDDISNGKLEKSSEDKNQTRGHPDIYSLNVRYTWKWRVDGEALCRYSQYGEHTKRDSSGDRTDVEPEGEPGKHDDKEAGNVHLYHVVTDPSDQVKVCLQEAKLTCNNIN